MVSVTSWLGVIVGGVALVAGLWLLYKRHTSKDLRTQSMATPVAAIAAVVVALTALFQSFSFSTRSAPPSGSSSESSVGTEGVGMSETLVLLDTRNLAPGAPSYCADADELLVRLQAALDLPLSALTSPYCVALMKESAFGGERGLEVNCRLAQDNACEDRYTARIWIEHARESTEHFSVKTQGTARRVCDTRIFESPKAREMSAQESPRVRELLQPCRG